MIFLPTNTFLGRLEPIEEYICSDRIILLSCKNSVNTFLITICTEEGVAKDVWLYAPVTSNRLENVRGGRIDLYNAFRFPEDGYLFRIIVLHEDRVLDLEPRSPESIEEDLIILKNKIVEKTIPIDTKRKSEIEETAKHKSSYALRRIDHLQTGSEQAFVLCDLKNARSGILEYEKAEIDYVWCKKLSASDALHPKEGAPINFLRLTGSFHRERIDFKKYFRTDFFAGLNWFTEKSADEVREAAFAYFHMDIMGKDLGIFQFKITHNMERIKHHNTPPTRIHWSERLIESLKECDYTGMWISIERDKHFRFYMKISSGPPKFRVLEEQISSFGRLPDNWDSHGATKIKRATVRNALKIMKSLPQRHVENLDPDDVYPNPYGTISIDWENDESFFSIEIGNRAATIAAQTDKGQHFSEKNIDLFENNVMEKLIYALDKVYKYNER